MVHLPDERPRPTAVPHMLRVLQASQIPLFFGNSAFLHPILVCDPMTSYIGLYHPVFSHCLLHQKKTALSSSVSRKTVQTVEVRQAREHPHILDQRRESRSFPSNGLSSSEASLPGLAAYLPLSLYESTTSYSLLSVLRSFPQVSRLAILYP